jgi:FkbM family methyltransferase
MMHAGQTFLDVGAHFGYYSLILADAGMRCLAFEPDPRNHPLFVEATTGVKNIELRRLAVSDEPGTAAFRLHASSAESRIASGESVPGRDVQVGVTTVDEIVFSEGLAVGGIKVDVEGFDRRVLRGARRTLREIRPVVCTESTWDRALADFAAGLDYRVGALVGDPDRDMHFSFGLAQELRVCPMLFLVPTERAEALHAVADAIIAARRH